MTGDDNTVMRIVPGGLKWTGRAPERWAVCLTIIYKNVDTPWKE